MHARFLSRHLTISLKVAKANIVTSSGIFLGMMGGGGVMNFIDISICEHLKLL